MTIITSIVLIVLAFKGKECKIANRILWIYACIIYPICVLMLFYYAIPDRVISYKHFATAIAHDLPTIMFASQISMITKNIVKKHPDISKYSIFNKKNN
ncbi:MAG: hypothetical protein ACI4KA_00095 [Oscillospiraceae bacterium]